MTIPWSNLKLVETRTQGCNGRMAALLADLNRENRKWHNAEERFVRPAVVLGLCLLLALVLLAAIARADGGPWPICAPRGICKP